MPETPLQVIKRRASEIVDIVEGYFGGPSGPVDAEAAASAFGRIVTKLVLLLPDLANAIPDPADKFLVPVGQTPQADQDTLLGFTTNVAASLAVAGVVPTSTVPAVAKGLAQVFAMFSREVDPEMWIRWGTGIVGRSTALLSAERFAAELEKGVTLFGDVSSASAKPVPEDFPSYDDVKEEAVSSAAPADFGAWIVNTVVRAIPGGSSKSDRRIGVAVHRALMDVYVHDFRDHLVIADGRARIEAAKGFDMQVSEMWTDAYIASLPATSPVADKIVNFWEAMRVPTTGDRMHPDIADLEHSATGVDPAHGWGWFEIKPMHSLARAYEELYTYYLPAWNGWLTVVNHPEWEGNPGTWQPPLVGLLPTLTPPRIYGAITAPPGCIGYITLEVKAGVEAVAVASVLTTLGRLLARLLQEQARKSLGDRFPDDIAVLEALCAVLVLALILWGLIEAAVVLAAALVAVGEVIALLVLNLTPLLDRLAQESSYR